MSKDDFSGTLEAVGHKVTKCGDPSACATVLATHHFDVVLADPSDAAGLKTAKTAGVLPVALKPSKDQLKKLKTDYLAAFDASKDALRLLPLLPKVAKSGL